MPAGTAKQIKSFRLSQGFWHAFIPNTNLLISPQNIKLEIWNLVERQIEQKIHPNMFCLRGKPDFSGDGYFFVLRGGCEYGKSEIKVYATDDFSEHKEFMLNEEVESLLFSIDGKFIYLGTKKGNLYRYNTISSDIEIILSIKDIMIGPICLDSVGNILYIPTVTPSDERRNYAYHYITTYDITSCAIRHIHVNDVTPGKNYSSDISGTAFRQGTLAVLTTNYHDMINNELVKIACLHAYDSTTETLSVIKENFLVPGTFSQESALSWCPDGLLACIGLDCVYLFDSANRYAEITIPFDTALSVVFSPCGTMLAIGGKKARIVLMDT